METVFFWDMDGVLIDSLGLDLKVVNPLLAQRYGADVQVSREFIQSKFALAIPEFIRDILLEVGRFSQDDWADLVGEYERLRRTTTFDLCPGVLEVLEMIRAQGGAQWVVSNNREEDIESILSSTAIRPYFDRLWGYDSHPQCAKKPAPDIYLQAFEAAFLKHSSATRFYVVEDSGLGVTAALEARRLWNLLPVVVYGVATGGDPAAELQRADQVLPTLESLTLPTP